MKELHTREHTQHVLGRMVLRHDQQEISILKTRVQIKYKKDRTTCMQDTYSP
jgi:hypothetical protein